MKISIVSNGNPELFNVTNNILEAYPDVKIHIFAPTYKVGSGEIKVVENIEYFNDIYNCILDTNLIINLISTQNIDNKYNDLSTKYNVKLNNAKTSIDMINSYSLLTDLNNLSGAVNRIKSDIMIINAGEQADVITSYLSKAHNINSYAVSRKADMVAETLLNATGMKQHIGKVNYKLAGINNNLWLLELTDKKGKDLYPSIREKLKDIDLKVTRNDLTRDGLRSLKFFGYYHSANVVPAPLADVILRIIKTVNSEDESTIYFNVINNNTVSEMDKEACIEIPFTVSSKSITRNTVKIPFQCILAMSDYASTVSVIVKALITKSIDMFKRSIKLDPYLASILTLAELEALSTDILNIESNIKCLLS